MFRTILTLLFIQCSLIAIAQDDVLYKVTEEMPRFEGCESAELSTEEKYECSKENLVDYVYSNLVKSDEDIKNQTTGRIIVQFIINTDGKTSDLNIVRSISKSSDQSVRDLFNKMNKEKTWRPGYHKNKAIRLLFTLPILYRPEDY